MKKTILLSLFILSLISSRVLAQSILISDLSGNSVNGTTITLSTSDINTAIMDEYLRVKNNTEQDLNLYVRRIINSEVNSSSNSFCFGVLCYNEHTDTSTTAVLLVPGHDTTFSGDYLPNLHSGLTSITYEFYDIRNPEAPVTAQVTVNYHLSPLNVGNELKAFDISEAFPNPASGSTSFEYNIPLGIKGTIVLRNLIGTVVREVELEKQEGKELINTSDLKDGIYFYSVFLNNKIELTRKLIIRH
jgi:hypothetical protein